MPRRAVIEWRMVDRGLRIGRASPGPANPQSEVRKRQSSYLPIREQPAAPRVRLAVAFVGHPEVGPADPIAAGDEPAEGVVEARLAAHRDAPDPRPPPRRLARRAAPVQGAVVARRGRGSPPPVLGPTFGDGRG